MKTDIYSFFSGMGIMDLGFEHAGFNIVHVNEINNIFLNCYKYIREGETKPKFGYSNNDIRSYLNNEIWNSLFPNFDKRNGKFIGFIGGPPCPDFSVAGTNVGVNGKNGQLTDVFIGLILKRMPDFFVFENVKGLYKTRKHRAYYEKIKKDLIENGYVLFDSIENALLYGVPQDRERLIFIGFRRKVFGDNIHYSIGLNRKYTNEKINAAKWPEENPFHINSYLPCPNNIIKPLTVQYWFDKNDVLHHPNSGDYFVPHNKDKFYTIAEGHIKGKSFKRLHRWKYSPTAAYGNNEIHLHPYLPRRLSVAEVMAIQSLPKYISLPADVSLSNKFKMIANGVPYLLAFGIAKELYTWLEKFKRNGGL